MFGDWDLLIWVVTGVVSLIVVTRFLVIPLLKEARKGEKKAVQIKEGEDTELTVKNVGKVAKQQVDNYLEGLPTALKEAEKVLEQQRAACAGLPADQSAAILKPLESKISQIKWVMNHQTEAKMLNDALTSPVVGRIAKRLLSGWM